MSGARRVVLTGQGRLRPEIGPLRELDPQEVGFARAGQVSYDPDAEFGGRNYKVIDRLGQLVLVAAGAALRDGGLDDAWRASHEVGMVLGTHFGSVRTIAGFDRRGMEAGPKYVKPFDFANSVINAAAGQAAIFFDLRGINATLSAGTTSGLAALAQGIDAIRAGKADQLLLGGADELCFEAALACRRAGLLSADDTGRPFDAGRNGMVVAEGAALVLAEEAEVAAARGARAHARLLGHGNAFDVTRDHDEQAAARALATAIHAALADAGLTPENVDLLAVGAAGSPRLDRLEALGLAEVFGERLATLPLLAVKGGLGESLAAGGAFQLLGALEALDRGEAPGLEGWSEVDAKLPAMAWSAEPRAIGGRVALLTAVGLDGSMAALLVESLGGSPAGR